MKILIIQTAFLGDVILTLPLAQALRKAYPSAVMDMVVIPSAAPIAEGSPVIDRTIVYDKKSTQRGIRALFSLGRHLSSESYDVVVTPHTSLRTAVLALLTGAPPRIGFVHSAFRWAFTRRFHVPDGLHEADRNLQLVKGLDMEPGEKDVPRLEPSREDTNIVDDFIATNTIATENMIIIAPGSVWFTKRWPARKYSELITEAEALGYACVLIGGTEDVSLNRDILTMADAKRSVSAAGTFSLLQSADLIRRAKVLVTNDSAPLHMGVAMQTRVIAIFGPTVPAFGFAPYGKGDQVVEREDLSCRPCNKHGGSTCPIGTFECMESITADDIINRIQEL